MSIVLALLGALRAALRTRADLALENLALRQQLALLCRGSKRPQFRRLDRLLWVWLSSRWARWREALHLVRPETVIRWHRQGFRAFWTWKSRHGRTGRPSVGSELANLVRTMALANPLWGAPRIHGELLKLGFDVSQRTVSRLMPRRPKPPSQTWRTFLAMDGRKPVLPDRHRGDRHGGGSTEAGLVLAKRDDHPPPEGCFGSCPDWGLLVGHPHREHRRDGPDRQPRPHQRGRTANQAAHRGGADAAIAGTRGWGSDEGLPVLRRDDQAGCESMQVLQSRVTCLTDSLFASAGGKTEEEQEGVHDRSRRAGIASSRVA